MSFITYHDADLNLVDIDLYRNGWLNDRCIYFGSNLLQYTTDHSFYLDTNRININTNPTDTNTNTAANNVILKFIDPSIVSFMKLQCEDEDEFHELAVGMGITDMNINMDMEPISSNNSNNSNITNPHENIQTTDIVFCLPINDSNSLVEVSNQGQGQGQGSHWSLLVVHANKWVAYHLDSYRSNMGGGDGGGYTQSRQSVAAQDTVEAFSKVIR